MTDRRKLWLRLALWALVIAWMAVIFYFSAQAADDSDRTSGRVVAWLIDHFDRSFSSLSPEAQLLRMEAWSFAVRKLAHFAVFAVLCFVHPRTHEQLEFETPVPAAFRALFK